MNCSFVEIRTDGTRRICQCEVCGRATGWTASDPSRCHAKCGVESKCKHRSVEKIIPAKWLSCKVGAVPVFDCARFGELVLARHLADDEIEQWLASDDCEIVTEFRGRVCSTCKVLNNDR